MIFSLFRAEVERKKRKVITKIVCSLSSLSIFFAFPPRVPSVLCSSFSRTAKATSIPLLRTQHEQESTTERENLKAKFCRFEQRGHLCRHQIIVDSLFLFTALKEKQQCSRSSCSRWLRRTPW